jgi:hypothetical protein
VQFLKLLDGSLVEPKVRGRVCVTFHASNRCGMVCEHFGPLLAPGLVEMVVRRVLGAIEARLAKLREEPPAASEME